MVFEVQKDESIDECLNRMKQQGYMPIRRMEEPIFQEVVKGNETLYEPVGRKIVFEGKLME
ncbi:NETI motif-containing protein [Neobacillus sp. LXY-1]|uniref:NETI motif-containing protein n=1 Tax=Neobacillus sp. LXY-1 TaxID=3379133 RepID=UPI003EE172AB